MQKQRTFIMNKVFYSKQLSRYVFIRKVTCLLGAPIANKILIRCYDFDTENDCLLMVEYFEENFDLSENYKYTIL